MKTIARKEDGDLLVEMTPEEMREFGYLRQAVKGENFCLSPSYPEQFITFGEAAQTFRAIRLWIGARMNLNNMERTLEKLRQILEPVEPSEEAESADSSD